MVSFNSDEGDRQHSRAGPDGEGAGEPVPLFVSEGKIDALQPLFPSIPVAGGRAGPRVMIVGELALPLASCST